jgi:hypothetical protein
LKVPIFGREEDDADQFSAYILLQAGKEEARRLMCRFSDAGMTKLSPRSIGRRPKSAKARNRGGR